MAYKLLDEQYKWKKQLHDKFDFDRGNYCGRADVGGEFQFSQSFLPPVTEKHKHQVNSQNNRGASVDTPVSKLVELGHPSPFSISTLSESWQNTTLFILLIFMVGEREYYNATIRTC